MKHLITALRYLVRNSGQCSGCGGVFEGWNGGVCDACRALGR